MNKSTKKKPIKKSVLKKKRGGYKPKTTVAERLAKKTWDMEQIGKIEMLGLTDKQLADILNVDQRTIDRWKKDKEFVTVLKRGKLVADNKMIESLYKSGLGYEFEEVKKEGASIESTDIISKVTRTIKHYPPVPASMIFWLKNRQGWVDKQDFGGFDDLTITVKLVD